MLQVLCKTKLVIASGETFKLNPDFKNKKLKVNINMPIKSEQKAESEKVHADIEEDRKMVIQACIVRLMKTRKRMKHNDLLTESLEQLKSRFKPQIGQIKVRFRIGIMNQHSVSVTRLFHKLIVWCCALDAADIVAHTCPSTRAETNRSAHR